VEPAARNECPKCGAACRAGQAACARCGLAADRMESYARERDAAIPDVLSAAWERTEAAWDDPAGHAEVMRLVAAHDAYAWAAARYRTRAGDPIGDRQIAKIRKAAEATMLATATSRKDSTPKPYRALTAVMIMLIAAAIAALLYANVMREDIEAGSGVVPAQPIRETTPAPPLGGPRPATK
jgi:hypothetical protein